MSIFKNLLNKRNNNPQGEMNFLDHVEDLRWHIIRSVAAILIGAIIIFINVEWIVDKIILGPAHNEFISYKFFCSLGKFLHIDAFCLGKVNMEFQNTSVAGQFMMGMSISLMLGFIIAFPFILWELWRFVKPALKPIEVKYAKGGVFWCSILFFLGVIFSYYIVIPYTINFFGNYKLSPLVKNITTMDSYYETMSNLTLAMGIVFELPVFVFFLSRIGILTPEILRKQRRVSILILFIISEIITPPDLFSCLLVFIPLFLLFEISVKISDRTASDRRKKEAMNE